MKNVKTSMYLTGVFFLYWISNKVMKSGLFPELCTIVEDLQNSFADFVEPTIERSLIKVPEAYMTTPEQIRSKGYPLEIHHVVTQDDYVMELHRIPHSKNELTRNVKRSRGAVFLQHGLVNSDFVWLINGNNSLAYILADNGYDVWMGNSRGNYYSRKHVSLDSEDAKYWDFAWDEMGRYDIPASINYVLKTTGQEKLSAFYGYSLGTTLFFIGAIHNPKLNEQVETVVALGPSVSLASTKNIIKLLSFFATPFHYIHKLLGSTVIFNYDALVYKMLRSHVEQNSRGLKYGAYLLYHIFGQPEFYDQKSIVHLLGHYPAGCSVKTMVQFLQSHNSGRNFLMFDHGVKENLIHYGTPSPPEYNLTKVTVPVVLVYGDNDPLAPPEDVLWLSERLGNVRATVRVPDRTFTHGDFIWSPKAPEILYYPLLNFLSSSPASSPLQFQAYNLPLNVTNNATNC